MDIEKSPEVSFSTSTELPRSWKTVGEARAERDAAIEIVAENSVEWQLAAREWLKEYLRAHKTFCADHLWEAGLARPRNPKALGPVIVYARHHNWISQDGWVRSRRRHCSPMPLWLSHLFVGG